MKTKQKHEEARIQQSVDEMNIISAMAEQAGAEGTSVLIAKIMRSIYLKGVMVGHEATIELTADIPGRDENNEYIKLAMAGSKCQATLTKDGWVINIHDHNKRTTVTVTIPLTNGKVR